MAEYPEWDACEDCLGSGGQRDEYGEGNCFACGGSGRLPANGAAQLVLEKQEEKLMDAAYAQAERDLDDGERY